MRRCSARLLARSFLQDNLDLWPSMLSEVRFAYVDLLFDIHWLVHDGKVKVIIQLF